jgi:hypothetical protein
MKRGILLLLITGTFSAGAMAQIDCTSGSAASTKLICEFPFATGALNAGSSSSAPTTAATEEAESLNIAMASQVSQLPIASASAGTVTVFKSGVPETFNNLGPILTDRGQTIGQGKVFIGFSASQFVFNGIDKNPLSALPFEYPVQNPAGGTTDIAGYINLAFKLNQYVGIATVGVSKRIDISAIIPWERVSLGAANTGRIAYELDPNGAYVSQQPLSSLYSAGTASGIGDVLINVKAMVSSGERSSISGELNVRMPTGDDENFLGSGAWGFNPFLVYSYLGKFSPHAKIGYQWNTKTELTSLTSTATSTTAQAKKVLPGGLIYDIGADYAMAKRITVAADLLGSQFLNTPGISFTSLSLNTSSGTLTIPTSTTITSSYTVNNFSAGLKISPVGKLVLAGNVLIQTGNNGLHSRPTPLVGISYKF